MLFDQYSFECIDFYGLSEIISSFTRVIITERKAEISILLWTQTKGDSALAECRLGLRCWRTEKPTLCLHAVTDEDGRPLENEDESGRRPCEYWGTIFALKASGTIAMRLSCGTSRKLLSTCAGKLTETNLMNSWPQRNRRQVPMGFQITSTGVLEGWALNSFTKRTFT